MNHKGIGLDLIILIVVGIVIAVGITAVVAVPEILEKPHVFAAKEIPKFSSCGAITAAFEESQSRGYGGMYETLGMPMMSTTGAKSETASDGGTQAPNGTPSYSQTNVQVEGVDEADIVKTDGTYIYTITRGKLTITKAYPAENAEVLSVTELKDLSPQEMFIDNDVVLVFGQGYEELYYKDMPQTGVASSEMYPSPYYNSNITKIQLWDASDKENPELKRTVEFEGSYLSSRKIGEYVYFAINSYPRYYVMGETAVDDTIVPMYKDSKSSEEFAPACGCADVGYLEPMNASAFVTVGSISMDGFDSEVKKDTVVASGQNAYASQDNLYLAEVEYNYNEPRPLKTGVIIPETNEEQTNIHKFALSDGEVLYQGVGSAPGHILNQFSMDEFENHFRIATTIGEVWNSQKPSTNNIYVFDSEMEMVGKLEDLAPGEKIYSSRFMGKKAYLVTFKKIDPLFVIDLSDPANPKVLGKLKIPGFSDYLHPFDETHIIGIGKEAVDAESDLVANRGLDFAWYQGVKIALFDVSDVEHPKEMYKEVIGDRGTDSYALQDHKAFLFDKEKQLLVVPILLAELSEEQKSENYEPNAYGEYVYQGAYVYKLSLENGFEKLGRITHYDNDDTFKKSGYYYFGDAYSVKRSLYIDDVLYTISDAKILANSLDGLGLVKELKLLDEDELQNNYYEYGIR